MKFETFTAGHLQQRYQYKSFEPIPVNQEWTWEDPAINTLLESATRALGELNAFSLIVPDIDLFIHMHVVKEAQTSSKIEGTQTGIDEALMPEDRIDPEKRDDWREVRNYVDAVNGACLLYTSSKRKELGDEHIADITRIFAAFEEVTRYDEASKTNVPISRIFPNERCV